MLLLSKMRVAILKRHGLTVFQGAKNHTTIAQDIRVCNEKCGIPHYFLDSQRAFSPKMSYILQNYRFFSCPELPSGNLKNNFVVRILVVMKDSTQRVNFFLCFRLPPLFQSSGESAHLFQMNLVSGFFKSEKGLFAFSSDEDSVHNNLSGIYFV